MLDAGSPSAANVLIVEDEFLVAMQLEDILTAAGYRVVGIVPDQVSMHAVGEPPEVAFVDLNLRDGPSGARIARQLAERFGTAIVYVTANPAQIGRPVPTAIGIVEKPFSDHAILAAISLATRGGAQDLPPGLDLCLPPAPE
jgi:DNA-binding response OmpR family regulator